ncbi:hypothetical protein KTAU_10800 [Thermogemmatispora aurantia]|uniref:Uncharacterized protein n=1 Tax=Thermogemmatispora aurantia TaxID=2045279 RepID=A0A5J4K4M0_9CHLR|nr:hypothetical protein KTAU_10800 [Thermogemmatispora aurantia]
MASKLTSRATHSLGHYLDFTMSWSKESHNAVCLTEVDPLEDNRSCGVATLLPHALESLAIKKT